MSQPPICVKCEQSFHMGAEECPHCGYHLLEAQNFFGNEKYPFNYLYDNAGGVRHADRKKIREALKIFHQRFPQIRLCFVVHQEELDERQREWLFWVFNQAQMPEKGDGQWGLLVALDFKRKELSSIRGYQISHYLSDADMFQCMSRVHHLLIAGEYARSFVMLIDLITKKLKANVS